MYEKFLNFQLAAGFASIISLIYQYSYESITSDCLYKKVQSFVFRYSCANLKYTDA